MLNLKFARGIRAGLLAVAATVAGGAAAEDLKIQTTKLPDGKVQAAYTATLEATGGTVPYTWTALSAMRTREASSWATYGQGGEATGWRQDGGSWQVPLPFDFPFYGKMYRTAYINENGLVDFNKPVLGTRTYPQWDNVGLSAFGNRDLYTGRAGGNIYVTTNSTEFVVIRWAAVCYHGDKEASKPTVNFAVVLFPDGQIRFTYGDITTDYKTDAASVYVGPRNESETDVEESYSSKGLSNAEDFVWRTAVLPDGLALAKDGTLSGKPTTVGAAGLVAQVTDTAGAAATNYFPLTIAENTNEAPVVESRTPAAEGATVKAGDEIKFAVTASDPEGAALSYTWKVNGVETNTTSGAAWTWQTDPLDCGIYTVTCEVSDGERSVPVTWSVFVNRGFTWHVATDGGDDKNNDGRDAARPFKTLAKALTAAGDGETILVGPGTYSEVDTSGTPFTHLRVTDGRRLTIKATANDPAQTVIDGKDKANCLVFTETQTLTTNVVVEGFTLRNGQTLSGKLAYGGGALGGDLRRCVITNCVAGFSGGGAAFAKLTDCTIDGCTAASDGGGAYACEVVRCIVRKNVLTAPSTASNPEGCGAGLAGGWARNTLIVENEIANTLKTGYGAGVCDTACTNCTIVANWNKAQTAYGGVAAKDAQKPCVNTIVYSNQGRENNAIYGLSDDLIIGTIWTGLSQGTSFVNWSGRDFRLAAGSIAIDAGTGHFAADETDLDGAARVQGWAIDCGAYEYKADYAVTGDAEVGFTVRVNTNVTDFVASFPADVNAENVTIEVSPEIKTVTPNGAAVKVVRTTEDATYYITEFLNEIPTTETGALDLASATVRDDYANPLGAEGAKIDLRDPSAPSLTVMTMPGLVYTLHEGKTLDALKNGTPPMVGDGQPCGRPTSRSRAARAASTRFASASSTPSALRDKGAGRTARRTTA